MPGQRSSALWVLTAPLPPPLQDFSKAEAVEIEIAIQEGIDLVRSVLTLGLEKAVSGVKVDSSGKAIARPHQGGKGVRQPRGPGSQGRQAAAKKAKVASQEGAESPGAEAATSAKGGQAAAAPEAAAAAVVVAAAAEPAAAAEQGTSA
jgi:PTH1 family peptidyl-tRNA hydrolase